jgi:integrase
MGVAVMLAFHCYLRIGELLRVQARDHVPTRSWRAGLDNPDGFLSIPKAKTGAQQDVTITDREVEWLLTLASRAAAILQPTVAPGLARVFPYPERTFRTLFAQCASSYGLPRAIVPHSLRHGATSCRARAALIRYASAADGAWRNQCITMSGRCGPHSPHCSFRSTSYGVEWRWPLSVCLRSARCSRRHPQHVR